VGGLIGRVADAGIYPLGASLGLGVGTTEGTHRYEAPERQEVPAAARQCAEGKDDDQPRNVSSRRAVDGPPEVAHLAFDPDIGLVQVPTPMGVLPHGLNPLLADLAGEHRAERTYIITTSRITSGEESNQRNGLSDLAMADR